MTFKDNSIKIDCILPIYIFIDLIFLNLLILIRVKSTFPLKKISMCAQILWHVHNSLEMTNIYATTCITFIMCVCVHCFKNLCACAHAHSLEGTLL